MIVFLKERVSDLRDTLKVTGANESDLNKATFGIFCIDQDDS
jgi:hypothetical protein